MIAAEMKNIWRMCPLVYDSKAFARHAPTKIARGYPRPRMPVAIGSGGYSACSITGKNPKT